ncbi:MAG TPA: adenylate/guanylate cyclase domain-containing protein, partial [Beijerinckiaceae bacterium]
STWREAMTPRRGLWRRAGAGLAALAPLAVGLALALLLDGTRPVERARNIVFDQYLRWAPRVWSPDLPVRVLDVDDASLARLGQWPWPRTRLAEITRALHANGAAAIGFDMLLSEPDRYAPGEILAQLPPSPEREALAAALGQSVGRDPLAEAFAEAPVVAALALTGASRELGGLKTSFVRLGDDPAPALPRFSGMIRPLPALAEAASGLGAINYLPDMDLVLRKAPLVLAAGAGAEPALVPSFALEALRVAFAAPTPLIKATNASGERSFGGHLAVVAVKVGDAEIPTEADGSVRIRFAGDQPGRRIPAWRLLAGDVPREEIEGRIILIGSSAAALADLRSTPLDAATPGVDVHAEVIEHALTGARLARPDWAPGAEALAILLGGAFITFAARRLRPATAATATGGLIAAGATATWLLFTRQDLLFDPLIPGLSWAGAYLAATIAVFRRADREKRFVRAAFQRYVAPAVVEQLAEDPALLRLGGETREVTVLFSDVRDFTGRAESLDAAGVVRFLNALHTPLTAAVMAERGAVDKYIGDGLMAFWNAPLPVPDHADRACAAALAMAAAAERLDAQMREEAAREGRPHAPVRIGVGVCTGAAFVGNMGSEQRFDYSVVGDTVNVAARLEAATKVCGVPIIVSEATATAARGHWFAPLGPIRLKGKARPVEIFALHGKKVPQGDDVSSFIPLHLKALASLTRGAPDAPGAVAAALAHPEGARYAAFYAW